MKYSNGVTSQLKLQKAMSDESRLTQKCVFEAVIKVKGGNFVESNAYRQVPIFLNIALILALCM